MGRIGNAIAGAVGTAIVTTNCFFAGTQDTPSILSSTASEVNSSAPSNSVVETIEAAPSESIDLSDYLSNVSEGIETAVEDHSKAEEAQSENEPDGNVESSASPPPNNEDDDDDEDDDGDDDVEGDPDGDGSDSDSGGDSDGSDDGGDSDGGDSDGDSD